MATTHNLGQVIDGPPIRAGVGPRARKIRELRLITTRRCPLICSYCSVSAGPARREMMDPEKAVRLVREFIEEGGTALVLTGGEPLLYPALNELLDAAGGLDVTLFTMCVDENTQAVSENRINVLLPQVRVWRVSLHGHTEEVHDSATNGPGSFEATRLAVRRLVSAGAEVHATFALRPDNLTELLPVAELCDRLGIRELRVVAIVDQGRITMKPAPLTEPMGSLVEDVDLVTSVQVRLGNAAKASLGLPNDCRAFAEELVVNVDGWLSVCHVVEPTPTTNPYDNVFEVGLESALVNSPRLASLWRVADDSDAGCADGCLMQASAVGVRPGTHQPLPLVAG